MMNVEQLRQLPNDYGKCTLIAVTPADKWCHIVTAESVPALHAFVQEASKKLGIKKPPQIVLYDSQTTRGNAGLNPFNNTIYLDLSFINFFNRNEKWVNSVIGHELGHRPQMRRTFIAGGLSALLSTVIDQINPTRIPLGLPVFLACLATLSRYNELDADYKGTLVTSPEDTIAVMEKLDAARPKQNRPNALLEILLDRGHWHPSPQRRIDAIKKRFDMER